MLSWQELLIYSPLGIIGVWRWGVWLWQKAIQFRYRPTPPLPNNVPVPWSLSIVTPVYNEDPSLFRAALFSWLHNHPKEIIAVIDQSDARCIDVFKAFASRHSEARLIITDIPGKRPALALGARATESDIIALVDSDTLWDSEIKTTLLAPFADPAVGGVAPRQTVLMPDTLAKRFFSIRLDMRYLHEFRYLSVVGDALTCLSGRTAVYRRNALLPILDGMTNETFMGKHCISGEDKRLTFLLQTNGWKTRYQQHACVRTPGMPRLLDFFKQSLRWGRNSWRTDLQTLLNSWVWKREPLFAYHLFDRAVQPFTLLLGPIYFGIALSLHHFLAAAVLVSWWIMSRAIKIFPHLKETPRDILVVPLFAVSQYVLAVLKIYALFTLDYQSWITRWHRRRILALSAWELLPSRMATVAIITGIAFIATEYEYSLAREAESRRARLSPVYTENFTRFDINGREGAFFEELERHRFGTYTTRFGDTPASIAHKYRFTPEGYTAVFGERPSFLSLRPGESLRIPIDALRHSFQTQEFVTVREPEYAYDAAADMLRVKGRGSVVTLPHIALALRTPPLNRPDVLTETAPGEWLLRSSLYIGEGVMLVLDRSTVTWLKIRSDSKGYAFVRSYNGSILIRDAKITSWDEEHGTPDTDYADGRAFILASANGRMDVLNSEIAYLGFPRSTELTGGKRIGGVYGLSWKIPNGTFGHNLLTGNVIGNRIHHNYFGLYTFGATGMRIEDNEIFDNIQYGIDPHDDSNNLSIENNFVYHNGNHGIITSKRVKYSTIRNNRSEQNRLHGLMLDRQSNYNLVEDNFVSGNVNGLALYDSHHNLVRRNHFIGNRFGVRANNYSSDNFFTENNVRSNEKGFFFYGRAGQNTIYRNQIVGNSQGVSFKETEGNIVLDSLSKSDNSVNIKTDAAARISNYIERIL